MLSVGDQYGQQRTEHKGLHDEEQEESLWGRGKGGREKEEGEERRKEERGGRERRKREEGGR